jgi:hypothetical protein
MFVVITTQPRLNARLPNGGRENPSWKTISWDNSSDRIWLTNHMHWAIHNGQCVTITPSNSESN